ncbi:MAG: metalloregulator ArsR/SmtB family transcription factor [Myxococcales bacterium]|nr:metalloregulator ArsR/SmtB family transcription factor [Myxococcales bacterium]
MARRRSRPPMLSDDAVQLVATRFRVLSDPARLRILNLLMLGECSVGDLVNELELEQPTVSRHLAVLRRERIAVRRAEGNRAFYRIEDPTVMRLFAIACGGLSDQLAGELDALPSPDEWRGSGI